MKRTILILVILLAAALALAGIWRSGWLKRDDRSKLHISGNIELTQVDISFKVAAFCN